MDRGFFRGSEQLTFFSKTVDAAPMSRTTLHNQCLVLKSKRLDLLEMVILHVHPLVRRLVERLERVEVRGRVAWIVLV